jgi:UDP-N-acetylmuramoyl-L-alanyl-D-glutamate--2,6-diaminopimelate ligase
MPLVAFTNLSRDHLDYHGTMERYAAAKERIFSCRDVRQAVINIDDTVGAEFAARVSDRIEVLRVSGSGSHENKGLFVAAKQIESRATGLFVSGISHAGSFTLNTRMVGRFNADNLLLTLGLLLASGMTLSEASDRMADSVPPPGRMESFECNGPIVVVDYAHTPDALAKALQAVRGHVRGKLYCVFGCGGDRDPGKRPLMAEIAESLADGVIVTDDNPRSEDPQAIVSMILQGFNARIPVRVEHDRAKAIRSAVESAVEGDVVLVAGKGHEETQTYGADVRRFSDREIARSLARKAA